MADGGHGRERPIRVVRIIDRLNIGGPAKHVAWLSSGLAARGCETVLLAGTIAPGEGDMSYFPRNAGVTPLAVAGLSRAISRRDAMVVVRIVRHLFRHRPDLVHTHKAKAGTVGRVAVALYRWLTPSALWLRPRSCRVVHTYHGHVFHSYYGRFATALFVVIERVLARIATDVIVTLSPSQRDDIVHRYRIAPAEKVRVVPLGIDLGEFPTGGGGLRRDLGVPGETVLVGTVGRLCEVKDHAVLLQAASLLGSEYPPLRFALIGDGHLRPRLEALAHRLGVRATVAFLGFRDDVPRLYPDLDVVALTSRNEGTPVTLLEAMACSRPVCATEVGGVTDIMGARLSTGDGFTVWEHGVTVPSRDPVGFARALRFMSERPALRRAMGARGHAFVTTHMSTERLVSDVEKLYRVLCLRDGDTGVSAGWVEEGVVDEGADHRGRRLHRVASR